MRLDKRKVVTLSIILLSLLGIVLSLYLLQEHLAPTGSTFCDISSKVSCDVVNKSPYADILGVPVSLLGALYWTAVLLLTLLRKQLARALKGRFVSLFRGAALLGLLFSLYLSAVEAFVLKVWCPLCVLSALATLVVTIIVFSRQETI